MNRLVKYRSVLSLALVAGMLCTSSTQVCAGSMGSSDVFSWNGFYTGVQGGGAWSHQNRDYTNPNYFNTLDTLVLGSRFDLNSNGLIGGGILGFNYQLGNWVAGLEGALSGGNLNATRQSPFVATDRYTSDINGIGAIKGRLAYAYTKWLFNINAGISFVNADLDLVDPLVAIQASSSKKWHDGWIVGVGIERKLTPQWSAGIGYEYSEIKWNNTNVTCPLCGTGIGSGSPIVNSRLQIQAVMARCTYLFNQ